MKIEKPTQKDIARLQDEVLSEKITLYCKDHVAYPGVIPPNNSCKGCWQMWYTKEIAKLPEKDRDEVLDLLEAAVNHAAELAEKGEFDVVIYDRPHIHTKKDAYPDK